MNCYSRVAKSMQLLTIFHLVLLAPALRAEDAETSLILTFPEYAEESTAVLYEFDDTRIAGFQRKKIAKNLRIRGWEIGNRLYLGQAKVADKWGFGIVYEHGDTVYGINHRGFQVMKRF